MPYTLADLRTRVRDILNESTAAFFSDAEIDRWLGDAAWDISSTTRCVEGTETRALAVGVRNYALATDAIEAAHVQDATTGIGLVKITPSMAGHVSSETDGDTPQRWYEYARQVWIDPRPNAGAAVKNITIFYPRITQDVTLLPEYCQLAAVYYVVAMGKLKDKLPQEAAVFTSFYLNAIGFRRTDVFQRDAHTRQDMVMADEVSSG